MCSSDLQDINAMLSGKMSPWVKLTREDILKTEQGEMVELWPGTSLYGMVYEAADLEAGINVDNNSGSTAVEITQTNAIQ